MLTSKEEAGGMLSSMSSQQGVHTPSHSHCVRTYEDEKSLDHEAGKVYRQLPNFCGKKASIESSKGYGLTRSHSFPPEGWHPTNYILKVSEPSQQFRERFTNDLNEQRKEAIGGMAQKAELDNLPECTRKLDVVEPSNRPENTLRESSSKTVDGCSSKNVAPPLPSDLQDSTPHSLQTSDPLPSGKLLFCGRRREMEDTATIVTPFVGLGFQIVESDSARGVFSDLHFFGVYDGHGGSQASLYCMERFHHSLAEEMAKAFGVGYTTDMWDAKWDEVMKATFLKVDKDVGGICPNEIYNDDDNANSNSNDDDNANSNSNDDDIVDASCSCCVDAIAPENVGTTAVVAIIGSSQIVVGNCGDSRAVLARGNTAMPLSRDHKPEVEDETNRIEAAGGKVICWDGYRVGGLLALSRAIGDRYLKKYVISEPEVKCIQRMPDDECLILGSDGLWDVVTNDHACEIARECLRVLRKKYKARPSPPGEDPAASGVAALLVKLAYRRGSKDNISVVVVDLKCRPRG